MGEESQQEARDPAPKRRGVRSPLEQGFVGRIGHNLRFAFGLFGSATLIVLALQAFGFLSLSALHQFAGLPRMDLDLSGYFDAGVRGAIDTLTLILDWPRVGWLLGLIGVYITLRWYRYHAVVGRWMRLPGLVAMVQGLLLLAVLALTWDGLTLSGLATRYDANGQEAHFEEQRRRLRMDPNWTEAREHELRLSASYRIAPHEPGASFALSLLDPWHPAIPNGEELDPEGFVQTEVPVGAPVRPTVKSRRLARETFAQFAFWTIFLVAAVTMVGMWRRRLQRDEVPLTIAQALRLEQADQRWSEIKALFAATESVEDARIPATPEVRRVRNQMKELRATLGQPRAGVPYEFRKTPWAEIDRLFRKFPVPIQDRLRARHVRQFQLGAFLFEPLQWVGLCLLLALTPVLHGTLAVTTIGKESVVVRLRALHPNSDKLCAPSPGPDWLKHDDGHTASPDIPVERFAPGRVCTLEELTDTDSRADSLQSLATRYAETLQQAMTEPPKTMGDRVQSVLDDGSGAALKAWKHLLNKAARLRCGEAWLKVQGMLPSAAFGATHPGLAREIWSAWDELSRQNAWFRHGILLDYPKAVDAPLTLVQLRAVATADRTPVWHFEQIPRACVSDVRPTSVEVNSQTSEATRGLNVLGSFTGKKSQYFRSKHAQEQAPPVRRHSQRGAVWSSERNPAAPAELQDLLAELERAAAAPNRGVILTQLGYSAGAIADAEPQLRAAVVGELVFAAECQFRGFGVGACPDDLLRDWRFRPSASTEIDLVPPPRCDSTRGALDTDTVRHVGAALTSLHLAGGLEAAEALATLLDRHGANCIAREVQTVATSAGFLARDVLQDDTQSASDTPERSPRQESVARRLHDHLAQIVRDPQVAADVRGSACTALALGGAAAHAQDLMASVERWIRAGGYNGPAHVPVCLSMLAHPEIAPRVRQQARLRAFLQEVAGGAERHEDLRRVALSGLYAMGFEGSSRWLFDTIIEAEPPFRERLLPFVEDANPRTIVQTALACVRDRKGEIVAVCLETVRWLDSSFDADDGTARRLAEAITSSTLAGSTRDLACEVMRGFSLGQSRSPGSAQQQGRPSLDAKRFMSDPKVCESVQAALQQRLQRLIDDKAFEPAGLAMLEAPEVIQDGGTEAAELLEWLSDRIDDPDLPEELRIGAAVNLYRAEKLRSASARVVEAYTSLTNPQAVVALAQYLEDVDAGVVAPDLLTCANGGSPNALRCLYALALLDESWEPAPSDVPTTPIEPRLRAARCHAHVEWRRRLPSITADPACEPYEAEIQGEWRQRWERHLAALRRDLGVAEDSAP